MSLIYSRSPFFIQSTSGSTATVSLYVWSGNSSSVPASAQYTLTKAHNSSGKATFEVSELIRDYVDQSFNGDYVTEAVWLYVSMVDGAGTGVSGKYLATDGYIDEDFVQYWSKSDNNLKSDEVLMSNDFISVPDDTTAMIPTKDADMAVFYKDGEVKFISELAGKNLFEYSEDFTNAVWFKNEASLSANEIESPYSSLSAEKITNTGTAPYVRYTYIHNTNKSYSVSIFAKAGNIDYLYIRALAISGSPFASFNINEGVLGDVDAGLSADINSFGDGWYRCMLTYTTSGSIPNNLIDIGISNSDNSRNATSGEYAYIFGAQLEQKSYSSEYSASDSNSSGAINYATSAGQSASTFYARVMKDGGTIIDENCSDEIMEYVSELDIDEAHIIKSDGKVEVISVETLPCNKYENVRLTFVNKFGALQDIHFSAKTTESMASKGSSYNSINFDYDNLSNNYGSHSVRDFNKNATVRHTLNTDYLHESYSEVFRQLIVSEEVWMEHKGTVKPVNVTTNSLQKKTHANNGLVQFTISVKESHSLINNIR